jgi:hypothetical protein
MSARSHAPTDSPRQARVLEISELPVSQVRGYAAETENVHFERRGGRTFLVSDR